MPPVVNLVTGIVLIPCALLVGWDGLLTGSAMQLVLTLMFLAVSTLQFTICARLRSRGCGWTERPRPERRGR